LGQMTGALPLRMICQKPARWAGLGKRPGASPLKTVIQIRKIAHASDYSPWSEPSCHRPYRAVKPLKNPCIALLLSHVPAEHSRQKRRV